MNDEELASDLLFNAICFDDLEKVQLILQDGSASFGSRFMAEGTVLFHCAAMNKLRILDWLLTEGHASIGMRDPQGNTVLLLAAARGNLEMIQWLLKEGGSNIAERNNLGCTALLCASCVHSSIFHFTVVQWLLEHGGARIEEATTVGRTLWDHLQDEIKNGPRNFESLSQMLRVALARGVPPPELYFLAKVDVGIEIARLLREGLRLRALLPSFLRQRQALLAEHTPLIGPLRALISGYEKPNTTEELWATGLGADQ
jgi:ankyrin repeat protein